MRRPAAKLACFLAAIVTARAAAAAPPPVPLAGTVRNRGDRVPLAGITVLLDEGRLTTLTAADGTFEFAAVPVGDHVAHLRGPLVGVVDVEFTLSTGMRTIVTWYVSRTERNTSTVRGRRVLQETVEQSLSPDEMKHIPGTQGDTVKAVQNLPGVARPPFNGGLIVVWGSAPEDTRTYVDGVYIPTLFHFSGLRSTVNSELVQSLTFLPGGYGVDHGRGLGGAIEVESRRPRSDGYHGFAQVDIIDLSAMVEGPITKNVEFAAAGRVSWLNLFLPFFLTGDVQASPRYWDYQAKLSWRASPRDDLDVFLFGSDDTLELILKDPDPSFRLQVEHHTFYHRALARYTHRFESGATFTITPSVGYDLPDNRTFDIGALPFHITNDQFEWNLRAVARIPVNPLLRIDAGIDYESTRFSLDTTQNVAGTLREGDNGGFGGLGGPDATQAVASDHMVLLTNHVAPFAAAVFSLFDKRLCVTPQLRVEALTFDGYPGTDRAFSHSALLFEPRLALRWQIEPRLSVRGSIGWYHQPPLSQDLSSVFGNPQLEPQSGIHYVLGADFQITPTLRVEVQGFYKDLRNLVVRGTRLSGPPLENGGQGRVYGGEILIRQELWKNFFGWLSYTISRSERRDHPFTNDPWRRFEYDQTHILTLVGSYKLPLGFRAGLRFRYATGNPYSPVARAYYDSISDGYVPLFGPTYSARLPSFNQLDLRLDKEFVWNRWKLIVYLDLENVYAARSAEAVTFNYSFTKTAYVSGLPFLPVIGARGEF